MKISWLWNLHRVRRSFDSTSSSLLTTVIDSERSKHDDSFVYDNQDPVPLQSLANTQPPHSPPPNGGILAWLQVSGSFCIFLNTW